MENNERNVFEYTYSAPTETEKKQIESIRRQYQPNAQKQQNPFERLKYLDSKVKGTATAVSLIFGILGCLIFGFGLTLILEWQIWLWGVVLMVVGIPPMLAAYPAYNISIKKGKEKYGEEILELSEKLLNK